MLSAKRLSSAVLLLVAACLAGTVPSWAEGPRRGHADLNGYGENPTLSSPASGTLDVRISRDGQSLEYVLSYDGLPTSVLFAHIHLGRPAINGGVMVFLCTNSAPPAGIPVPPHCPQVGGTVSGVLTAADVIGPPSQGLSVGEFAEVIRALEAIAAYANVHTTAFPGGEIRGQVTFRNRHDD
jgi:hypothetical protein